jgi:hypothetical protein
MAGNEIGAFVCRIAEMQIPSARYQRPDASNSGSVEEILI